MRKVPVAKKASKKTAKKKATTASRKTSGGAASRKSAKKAAGRTSAPKAATRKGTPKAADRKIAPKVEDRKTADGQPGNSGPSTVSDDHSVTELPKCPLSEAELEEFRQLLITKRSELVGNVRTMTNEALRENPPTGSGNLSSVPIHMADMGSDNWEQEFTLGLLATERQLLREIDAALGRIDNKTYGICEGTHKPIGKRRLRASPWARHCIEYARAQESGRSR